MLVKQIKYGFSDYHLSIFSKYIPKYVLLARPVLGKELKNYFTLKIVTLVCRALVGNVLSPSNKLSKDLLYEKGLRHNATRKLTGPISYPDVTFCDILYLLLWKTFKCINAQ